MIESLMLNLSGDTTIDKQSVRKASCCLITLPIFESAVPVKASTGTPEEESFEILINRIMKW